MIIPDNLKYTKEHEWTKIEGSIATIGITAFAQDQLGDVVFVELPAVGKELKAGDEFGVVESVKSVSSLYAPVSGKVVEANSALANNTKAVNQDPYGQAWMIKIAMSNPAEVDSLLSMAQYEESLAGN
ncbi:glycine cleavage system protein H [Candidatus Saganbacteria bacterium CG08_land_8_20_14_0_20_45_16]|uniref:Glycine cleavage system H protein n=1 Tax=Candidatus Saganbacteria bacterium CG08_land_8_20_14_0_20_45_16 TaxID=2014293 RepID=A0A2H0XWZ4_UNCSA|nr:MAG: glycine cleavage system protein H [Candidatus Saganbacteria bacterium CG08_land_8_20_14_0_20_45_16]